MAAGGGQCAGDAFWTRWSTAWAQAGFVNHSTGIPTKTEERLGRALSLVKVFTANPTFEVPSMKLTAQGTLTTAVVNLNMIGEAWTAAYETLVGAMRALIKNLEGKLAKNDPRWLAFGMNMSATSVTPGKPVNVTAHTEYQLAASGTEPLASIAGGAAGQTVQIIVQAANGSQQGGGERSGYFCTGGGKGCRV